MRTNQFRLLWVALLSLSGVLPAVATDYEAADYLPLAVGNSWTYGHYHSSQDKSQWSTYTAQVHDPRQFTITVERTEIIDGKTYYVISDMPANWPPAPPHFIAGKKLRWEGTHLMERTVNGEQAIYRFDGGNENGYAISTDEGANRVTVEVLPELVPVYVFSFHGNFEGGQEFGFLAGYGLDIGGWTIFGTDHPIFRNEINALRAVIGGTSVEYEDALMSTASQSSSWGRVKQSLMVQSPEGRTNQ